MNTGIACDPSCIEVFGKMKMDKSLSFIIFKIDDTAEHIVVEKTGEKGESYEAFCGSFPEKGARYGVFDYHMTNGDGRQINKIVFVAWCSAGTKMQDKFKYASSMGEIKSKLQGVSLSYEARVLSDIDAKEVVEKDLAKF